jgi:transposase
MLHQDKSVQLPHYRKTRYFSEDFKQKKVGEIERRETTVDQVGKAYEVSRTSIYKWIYKYSLMRKKGIKMVVEAKSDTTRIMALQQRVAELEQLLGKKQFELDFMEKQIQIASEQYGVDLKKKHSGKPSPGSGKTGKNTVTK